MGGIGVLNAAWKYLLSRLRMYADRYRSPTYFESLDVSAFTGLATLARTWTGTTPTT